MTIGIVSEEKNTVRYKLNKINIDLTVDGFWEKTEWFTYIAKDCDGNIIEKGDSPI